MIKVFSVLVLVILSGSLFTSYTHSQRIVQLSKSTSVHNVTAIPYGKPITAAGSKLTRLNFEDSVKTLFTAIGLERYGMNYEVFRNGLIGYHVLKQEGRLSDKKLISFIDFTKKSTEKRFYTIDLNDLKVKFYSYVSHGRNTGEDVASKFSNTPHSNQSSLGFYITGETYVGSKGYSLRLDGVDGKYNNNMRKRAVVMHDAEYVSDVWINKYGRLGRSQGCPALPKEISRQVINMIKDKTVIFAYYNDPTYLKTSANLNMENLFRKLNEVAIPEGIAKNS